MSEKTRIKFVCVSDEETESCSLVEVGHGREYLSGRAFSSRSSLGPGAKVGFALGKAPIEGEKSQLRLRERQYMCGNRPNRGRQSDGGSGVTLGPGLAAGEEVLG